MRVLLHTGADPSGMGGRCVDVDLPEREAAVGAEGATLEEPIIVHDVDVEDAIGWIVLRWTCPHCEEVTEEEGDVDGDRCECARCGRGSIVRRR